MILAQPRTTELATLGLRGSSFTKEPDVTVETCLEVSDSVFESPAWPIVLPD